MQNSKTFWWAAITSAIVLVSMAIIVPTEQLTQHSKSGHDAPPPYLAQAHHP